MFPWGLDCVVGRDSGADNRPGGGGEIDGLGAARTVPALKAQPEVP